MNNPVYIFDKDATDFSTTGLVGDIKPISALFDEEKNGISQVTLRLTYDELNRWKAAKVGNFIRCKVPVRVPPVIREDEYANNVKEYVQPV